MKHTILYAYFALMLAVGLPFLANLGGDGAAGGEREINPTPAAAADEASPPPAPRVPDAAAASLPAAPDELRVLMPDGFSCHLVSSISCATARTSSVGV